MKKHRLTGEGGKGSARRNANEKAYADNWDKIFGKKMRIKMDKEQFNYEALYTASFLNNSDGANHVKSGLIKYGDALATIGYIHNISYSDMCNKFPSVNNNERYCGGSITEQLEFISANSNRNPGKILEIGSGRGEVSLSLAKLGYDVTAVEVSANIKDTMRETEDCLFGKDSNLSVNIINKPLHLANINYKEYDSIIMIESLEHILAEHFDPEFEKISKEFTGYFAVSNWLEYHPIAVGQFASADIHCRLVNDSLYDHYASYGKTIYRDRSHLCVDIGK